MALLPDHSPDFAGLTALCRELAPAEVRVAYCPTNALPYRVEWDTVRGPAMFYGLVPDAAAEEARRALAKGSARRPGTPHATAPQGKGAFVEALQDWIESIDEARGARESQRPALRLVRGGRVASRA